MIGETCAYYSFDVGVTLLLGAMGLVLGFVAGVYWGIKSKKENKE